MQSQGASAQAEPAGIAKILLDTPSGRPALGFHLTAAALAQVITHSDPHFAIGIFGGWGSGKTTLMRAIQAALPPSSVVAVEFNAWRFEREPQLLVPLIDTVRAALVDWSASRDAETRERVRGVTRRIARVVRSLAAGLSAEVGLPGAAKVSYDVGKAMDVLTASGDADQPQSLYVAAFQELSQAFADLTNGGATRVVVFVDDLDRCLPGNALEVLESIKLFFDLPGFIFVVGLDEDVVQRAVRERFSVDISAGPQPGWTGYLVPAEHPKAGSPADLATTPGMTDGGIWASPTRNLERDYVEKIFQVPYRLPPIVADQLDSLLTAMYEEADLPQAQLDDFKQRVTPHLSFVAVERRVNPREVKRFLNTYTLQMLVRPGLERDIVLALQTLLFRYEWRPLYDAILTDSMLFTAALARYRGGDDSAFEDLSPELRVLPPDLRDYLRSPVVTALEAADGLDPYLSSLESTSPSVPGLRDAYRDLGELSAAVRELLRHDDPGIADAQQLAETATLCASKLIGSSAWFGPVIGAMVASEAQQVSELAQKLHGTWNADPNIPNNADAGKEIRNTTSRIDELANQIYRTLRTVRNTSGSGMTA